MKNYLCHKCKTLTQADSSPSWKNCPAGGNHEWTDLGDVGTTSYQCKNCGIMVKGGSSSPTWKHCPSGGNHSWNKL